MGPLTSMATTDTAITNDLGWLKTHAILLGLVVVLIFGGVYGVDSLIARHDDALAVRAQIVMQQQQAANQQFQAQIQQQIATLAAQNQQLLTLNTQLATALAQRQTVEKQIPVQNANLTVEQTATKIADATHGVATASGPDVVLDLPTAKTVLNMVQLVPLLVADKADLTKQVDAETQIAANNLQLYHDEQASHASDNKTNQDVIAFKDAEIKKVKAHARKQNIIFYVAGVVSGYMLRVAFP